jgi:hypothetical protein
MFRPIWAIITGASVVLLELYKIAVSNRFIVFGRAENLKYCTSDSIFEALLSDAVMMRGFPRYAN